MAWIGLPLVSCAGLRAAPSLASAEGPERVSDEQDQQYGAEPYARAPTMTPAAVAVEPSPTTENQDQDDDQYQHGILSFFVQLLALQYLFNLSGFLLDLAGEFFILAFGSQVGVVGNLANLLFHRALKFKQIAFHSVLRALFHLLSP
jgi:hypothetical protein